MKEDCRKQVTEVEQVIDEIEHLAHETGCRSMICER
jgi:hypothetical protein